MDKNQVERESYLAYWLLRCKNAYNDAENIPDDLLQYARDKYPELSNRVWDDYQNGTKPDFPHNDSK